MTAEIHARFTPLWDTEPEARPYPPTYGSRYLLPCHLLHHGGMYEYVLIDVAQARQWLLSGPCMSWLTHPFLHQAFQDLMGFLTPPPQKGRLPVLGFDDDALCFVVEGYEQLPDLKRGDSLKVRQLVQEQRFAIGLLRRLA